MSPPGQLNTQNNGQREDGVDPTYIRLQDEKRYLYVDLQFLCENLFRSHNTAMPQQNQWSSQMFQINEDKWEKSALSKHARDWHPTLKISVVAKVPQAQPP